MVFKVKRMRVVCEEMKKDGPFPEGIKNSSFDTGCVRAVAFNPGGDHVAAGTVAGEVAIFSAEGDSLAGSVSSQDPSQTFVLIFLIHTRVDSYVPPFYKKNKNK